MSSGLYTITNTGHAMILHLRLSDCDLPALQDACERGTVFPITVELAGQTFIIHQRIAKIRQYEAPELDDGLKVSLIPMLQVLLEVDEPRSPI